MTEENLDKLKEFFEKVKVVPVSYMTGEDKILMVSFEELTKLKTIAHIYDLPIKTGYND